MINLHGCKQALVEYAFRLQKPGGFTVGKLVAITRAIYTGAPQHRPHCQPLAQRSASWAPCAHRTSVSPQPAQPQPNFLSTHLLHLPVSVHTRMPQQTVSKALLNNNNIHPSSLIYRAYHFSTEQAAQASIPYTQHVTACDTKV